MTLSNWAKVAHRSAATSWILTWLFFLHAIAASSRAETVILEAVADSAISEGNPSSNFGSDSALVVGVAGGEWHSLIRWDIAGNPELKNATITGATVELRRQCSAQTPSQVNTLFRRLNASWSEGTVTWNNAPSSTLLSADYYEVPGCTSGSGWLTFLDSNGDFRDFVQEVVDGGAGDFGLVVGPLGGSAFHRYRSKDEGSPPRLVIEYEPGVAPQLVLSVNPVSNQEAPAGSPYSFTVSVQADGSPVPGVLVPVSDDLLLQSTSVTTDEMGQAQYSRQAPESADAGSYDVAFGPASKTGYSPSGTVERTVTVVPPGRPFPVLLIHGFKSGSETWDDMVDAMMLAGYRFGGNFSVSPGGGASMLSGSIDGDIFTIDFSSSTELTLAQQGVELAHVVNRIVSERPGPCEPMTRVALVGHSMGGLAARRYVQFHAGAESKVVKLVTIGTPHHGSFLADMADYLADGCDGDAQLCLLIADVFQDSALLSSVAVQELRPSSTSLAALNNFSTNPLPGGIDYFFIAVGGFQIELGSGLLYWASWPVTSLLTDLWQSVMAYHGLLSASGSAASDGIVPYFSQAMVIPSSGQAFVGGVSLAEDIFHTSQTSHPDVISTVLNSVGLTQSLSSCDSGHGCPPSIPVPTVSAFHLGQFALEATPPTRSFYLSNHSTCNPTSGSVTSTGGVSTMGGSGYVIGAGDSHQISFSVSLDVVGAHQGSIQYTHPGGTGTVPVTWEVYDPTPSPPTGVSATSMAHQEKIVVSWSPVASADRYDVFRANAGSGNFSLRGFVGGSITSFDDFVSCGSSYRYSVRVAVGALESGFSAIAEGASAICPTPTPSPTPSPTPTPTPYDPTDSDGDGFTDQVEAAYGSDPHDPESTPNFGDFNDDGATNAIDALMIARAIARGESPAYDARYDMNLDGMNDETDAMLLYLWSIGSRLFPVIPRPEAPTTRRRSEE